MKACLLSLLPFALVACMSVSGPNTHTTALANASVATSTTALSRYHWQLHDAVDGNNKRLDTLLGMPAPPLQLDFSTDRIRVSNACNSISGGYTIVEGHLVTTQLLQTMMACTEQALMQRETTIKAVLRGRPTLILTAGDMPMLTLAADSGVSLTFAGKPIAQPR